MKMNYKKYIREHYEKNRCDFTQLFSDKNALSSLAIDLSLPFKHNDNKAKSPTLNSDCAFRQESQVRHSPSRPCCLDQFSGQRWFNNLLASFGEDIMCISLSEKIDR